ncbi:uncharacterized protein A1O9_12615 [Exophiala aquamarina CBS 119918]|uniref:AMP-dependent synthetase/ligase domain-containing protein n=1 Tax=Exophiala aquamarina CBS 119918 TaxID=1182545 RepID=A0A072P6S1_9EURO|nr:uncharacterized protein A1O9_12615 [Exophiala aquamarina CBS 119918]KEF51265.1 hypothetical protein A1O9_12615 [Exophiala aquamarina CBS 119918]
MAPPLPLHAWSSADMVDIPHTDILTFAFERVDQLESDKPIFIEAGDPKRSFTPAQVLRLVRQLAKGLRQHGLKDGDCVGLHSYNNIEYPVLWLGIIAAGGIVSGSNPAYTATELTRHFNLTRPKFIIAQLDTLDPVLEASAASRIPSTNVFCLGASPSLPDHGCKSWDSLLHFGEYDWQLNQPDAESTQTRIAVYAMTSGTTGLPKAALISHRYVVAQTAMLEGRLDHRPYQPSQLICLPVFHAFASPLALILPLRAGIPTYFLPRFNLADVLGAIHRFSITDLPVVPPIIAAFNQLSASDKHLLKPLQYVICAGAPMAAPVQSDLYNFLCPDAVIAQCLGTTETGWLTLFAPREKDVSGSVGRLMPNVQLKVVAENGDAIFEDDVPGEGFVRTPAIFSGYLCNSEESAASFDSDGFYGTGDRIYVRSNKVFHSGRIKEIMKVNGWQVSPTELEGVLLQHPRITDVAVAGITRLNRSGLTETLPRAYVVRASVVEGDTPPLTEQEVTSFVASRLISYKHLKGGAVFVKAIPRSNTGKILRRLLESAELDDTDHNARSNLPRKRQVVLRGVFRP